MTGDGSRRQVLYLDTSVFSAYYDERVPARSKETRAFFGRFESFRVLTSDLVRWEISGVQDPVRRQSLHDLTLNLEVAVETEEAEGLSREYLDANIFTERYDVDARHVAIATSAGADFVVSWNFRHLVRVKTRREVNLVNALKGFRSIEIVAPSEL